MGRTDTHTHNLTDLSLLTPWERAGPRGRRPRIPLREQSAQGSGAQGSCMFNSRRAKEDGRPRGHGPAAAPRGRPRRAPSRLRPRRRDRGTPLSLLPARFPWKCHSNFPQQLEKLPREAAPQLSGEGSRENKRKRTWAGPIRQLAFPREAEGGTATVASIARFPLGLGWISFLRREAQGGGAGRWLGAPQPSGVTSLGPAHLSRFPQPGKWLLRRLPFVILDYPEWPRIRLQRTKKSQHPSYLCIV